MVHLRRQTSPDQSVGQRNDRRAMALVERAGAAAPASEADLSFSLILSVVRSADDARLRTG